MVASGLMASKSARMRGSAHLKAVTVAHQKSYVIYIMSIVEAHIACRGAVPKDLSAAHLESTFRCRLPLTFIVVRRCMIVICS